MNKSFRRLATIASSAGIALIFVVGSVSIGGTGGTYTAMLNGWLSGCSTSGPTVTFKMVNHAPVKAQFTLTTSEGDSIIHTVYNVAAGKNLVVPRDAEGGTTTYRLTATIPNHPQMAPRTWVVKPATCRIVRAN